MMERFHIRGPLSFYGWDSDDEIEVEFDGMEYTNSVYLDRAKAIELRDWLNTQVTGLTYEEVKP